MKLIVIRKLILGLLLAVTLASGTLPLLATVLRQQVTGPATVLRDANLRTGPGVTYGVVGKVNRGQVIEIVDSNPAGTWYKLASGTWVAAFLVKLAPAAVNDQNSFRVVTWNTELNDAEVAVIARRVADFQEVNLWGLVEVTGESAVATLEAAAETGENADYASILSVAGGGDRLLAIYDTTRFALVKSWEIDEINTTASARSPLVLHLRQKSNGAELLFMVNHLYRTKETERHKQAKLLNEWVAQQTLPVIAVGDYNFDWDVRQGAQKHDTGYDLLTRNQRFTWVQPKTLVASQCTGWPCKFDSVLDFVFVAGAAQTWRAEATIVVEAGDFPDNGKTSDHRPVLAQFWPLMVSAPTAVVGATPPNVPTPVPVTITPTPVPTQPTVATVSDSAHVTIVVLENRGTYELIGIRNDGVNGVDLSGWVFSGSKGNDSCTIPAGSILQPGQIYQVATGDSQPGTPGYKCGRKLIWNNKGETIYLKSADGQQVFAH